MGKDDLPVKKPKGKSVIIVETLSEGSQIDDLTVPTLKEQFDLDTVEKELLELEKQGGFLDQFFSSSEERTLKKLKIKNELLGTRHNIRQNIVDLAKQKYTARIAFLELKAGVLEKEVMSQEKFQKTLMEIKLTKLNMEKLRIDLEELDLLKKMKQKRKELEEDGETGIKENYDLKDFKTLSEPPDDQGGSEEGGT